MHPPKDGGSRTSSAAEWTIDFEQLEKAISPRTKMLVINTPREYSFQAPPIPDRSSMFDLLMECSVSR